MKRALFSSEAGQGSSPIAHSAAKTDEPVREGVVAGLEPFIDTLVVCTLTSLVILSTGVWNRETDIKFVNPPVASQTADGWVLSDVVVADVDDDDLVDGHADVFTIVEANENSNTGLRLHRWNGSLTKQGQGESATYNIEWSGSGTADGEMTVHIDGVYYDYKGATLTAKAFDSATPGLGKWLVSLAAWLFAVSTMISWSYYGEQGVVYLFGTGAVFAYKIIYCLMIVLACIPALIATDAQLDNLTALGTGVMLWANIPIMLVFGALTMRTYHDYFRRMKSGEAEGPHKPAKIVDVMEGHDVE